MMTGCTRKLSDILCGIDEISYKMEMYQDGKSREDYLITEYANLMRKHGAIRVGKGSSRIVFRIGCVAIKVAFNRKGISQNKAECRIFNTNNSACNRNICASSRGYWVVAKYAHPLCNKKVIDIYGVSKKAMMLMIDHVVFGSELSERMQLKYDRIKRRCIFSGLRELVKSRKLSRYDIDGNCPENYGIVDNRIVVIDGGLTNYIWKNMY